MTTSMSTTTPRTDLPGLLHEGVVKTRLGATEKYGAIEELLELFVHSHDLPVRRLGAVRESLFRQERKYPSGVASGVAFPHDLVPGLGFPLVAVGVAADDGIDFGGSKPSKLIVLGLFPGGAKGHPALPILEERLMKDAGAVDELAACDTARELLRSLGELATGG